MLLLDMQPTATVHGTLEDLLVTCAPVGRTVSEGTCLVCEGETFRVDLRSGYGAWACRECGSLLEDDSSSAAA